MYKIITHNIKEEHYDHPMTAEYGMTTHANTKPHMQHLSSMSNEITLSPISVEFRMNVRSLFSRFFWRTREYLVSLLDDRESSDVESELYNNIDNIGSFIDPYYGTTIANDFNNSMKDVIKNVIFVVRDFKSGKELMTSKTRLSESINTLANFLNRINPTQWPHSAVVAIFSDLTNNWLEQISSRKNKDWIGDMMSVDKNEDLMLSGDPQTGSPSFSEIFSKGIIAENQQRFI
jgi:hypothetical protein